MKGVLFVYTLATLGMCCGFFSPFIGVCVYVLFGVMAPNALWYYSLPPTYLNTGFGFSEVVAYPMILGWFMNRCGNLNIGKAYMPLFLLCGYTLWVFISMMFTSWSQEGMAQILMNIRLLLAVFIIISLCDTVQKLRIIIWCLVFGSGFVAYELNMSYLSGFNRLQMVGYSGMDNNFFAVSMVVGCVVAMISMVWFLIGGIVDMRRMFRDLAVRTQVNDLDNGMVEGNVSLADKAAFAKLEQKEREK